MKSKDDVGDVQITSRVRGGFEMVGMKDLNEIARRNPKMNKKGVFQFVGGMTKKSTEKKAKQQGLKVMKGSYDRFGNTYRLIGYKEMK